MPEVSIIMPVYNKKKYLHGILDDLRWQTFRDFECIIVDDGSTDGSGDICRGVAHKDPRFHVISILNGGVSHARNVGLDHAKGKYLSFVDGDDRVDKKYIENLYQCIEKSGADMVISGCRKVWDDARKLTLLPPFQNKLMSEQDVFLDFARVQKETGIYGYCVAKIFPRHLTEGIRFDESLSLAEDFDFYLRLYSRVSSFYFDDKAYYYYRQETENSPSIVLDDKIDYLSQLYLNLRYRTFLREVNAYNKNNRKIVEELMQNYVYFSIFYCPEGEMQQRFKKLMNIQAEEQIPLRGNSLRQKVVFLLLRLHAIKMEMIYLKTYRWMRKRLK